jgi:hypothetical protein
MRWVRQLFTRRRRYDDLSISIREHLEEKTEELMEEGLSREEATRRARKDFGNATLIEEQSREAWQWPAVESIWADVKYGLRQLRKAPGFAIAVVVTMALGIGANTAIFTLVHAVQMKSLPVSLTSGLQSENARRQTAAKPKKFAARRGRRLRAEFRSALAFVHYSGPSSARLTS